jgi:CHAT domain-containing protein
MNEFYKTGKEKSLSFYNSLSETKRKFISGKFGEKWRDPFFWAPFVQYGEN